MFESVLGEVRRPRRRFGAGAIVAVALHAAGVAVAAGMAAGPAEEPRDVEVTFVRPVAAPSPPPTAPPALAQAPAPARRPSPRPAEAPATVPTQAIVAPTTQAIVAPTTMPAEAPLTPALSPLDDEVAGVPGSVEGPVVDASAAPVEFDARMSHPVKISGPDPRYTPEAIAREIEGTMLVRCVVTVEGTVRGCRVVRGLPFMDGAVVEALERRRYRPAALGGKPVEVDYLFRLTMRLP